MEDDKSFNTAVIPDAYFLCYRNGDASVIIYIDSRNEKLRMVEPDPTTAPGEMFCCFYTLCYFHI